MEGRVENGKGRERRVVNKKEKEGKRRKGGMGGDGKKGNFLKCEILTASMPCSAHLRHRAQFCADRSNRCGDMAVFYFPRWRLSAILDF